jgi:hypothetical protein
MNLSHVFQGNQDLTKSNCSEVRLQVFGDHLIPEEITKLLGNKPTSAARKDDLRPTRSKIGHIVEKTGRWSFASQTSFPANIDAQIQDIFAQLTYDLATWKDVTSQYRCMVFCGLFMETINEGVILLPETISILSERRLNFDLDIYASTNPQNDQ